MERSRTAQSSALTWGIQAIREHLAIAYISHPRKVNVITHDDQKWIQDIGFQWPLEAGLNRIFMTTEAARKFVSEVPISG